MTKNLDEPALASRVPSNRLLASLARGARQRILAECVAVELQLSEVVYEPGATVRHVYFPTQSFVSLMIPVDSSSILEVGLVGDEGMLGLPLLLGFDTSPLRAVVQGPGHAWRMGAEAFIEELARNPLFRQRLQRYLQVSFWQLAQTAACTRFHLVEQRLARWLLMSQDRAHRDQFHVTHEFLAYMLGVRRVGVTKAASALQRRRLIKYHRGEVTILNRAGMKSVSCTCYQSDLDTYDGVLAGPEVRPNVRRALALT
jgi:CRP-like cAMP-binding protein